MKDVGSDMGVKNISELDLKEIYGICETKKCYKKQVNQYKITKIKIYKQSKIIKHFMSSKKFFLYVCMYKIYLISA